MLLNTKENIELVSNHLVQSVNQSCEEGRADVINSPYFTSEEIKA